MQIIGNQVIRLQDVESTNNYAANLISTSNPPDGTVILAHNQFGGKGQRGSNWSAEKGLNLTISIILYPRNLLAVNQFDLSKMIAVSVAEAIDEITGMQSEIKWPNDILLNGKKVAGVLIENSLAGNSITQSIVGIGINVNQLNFDGLPRASSMAKELKTELELETVLDKLLSLSNYYYMVAQRGLQERIDLLYTAKLFRYKKLGLFKIDGELVTATVIGVKKNGHLEIEISTGQIKNFENKEIEFVY